YVRRTNDLGPWPMIWSSRYFFMVLWIFSLSSGVFCFVVCSQMSISLVSKGVVIIELDSKVQHVPGQFLQSCPREDSWIILLMIFSRRFLTMLENNFS